MSTLTLDPSRSVGELVTEKPLRSRVFQQHGVDFCCGGKVSLEEACRKHDLDLAQITSELLSLDADPGDLVDADAMGLTELADHIEATHHVYLRRELPRLDLMTEKVARVHGAHEPRLVELRSVFEQMQAELKSHMIKEEQILFPMVRQIEHAASLPCFHCGSLANPVRQMELEHDQAGNALARFRDLTDGFQPPMWACNTFRAMYAALEELEGNMHQHVHKENNVLFPKALAREKELAALA